MLMAIQPTTLNHRYTTPNKLWEAIAAGVPVVASDLPGHGAVVLETGCGELGRPDRPRRHRPRDPRDPRPAARSSGPSLRARCRAAGRGLLLGTSDRTRCSTCIAGSPRRPADECYPTPAHDRSDHRGARLTAPSPDERGAVGPRPDRHRRAVRPPPADPLPRRRRAQADPRRHRVRPDLVDPRPAPPDGRLLHPRSRSSCRRTSPTTRCSCSWRSCPGSGSARRSTRRPCRSPAARA